MNPNTLFFILLAGISFVGMAFSYKPSERPQTPEQHRKMFEGLEHQKFWAGFYTSTGKEIQILFESGEVLHVTHHAGGLELYRDKMRPVEADQFKPKENKP